MSDILSSGPTECSSGWKDTVALGRRLVEQLGDYNEDIALGWMAHHVARLMVEADAAVGEEMIAAQERCRRAILDLWHSRNAIFEPAPLSDIEKVADALVALREGRNWYFERLETAGDQDVAEYVKLAQVVDDGARSIIRALIGSAVQQGANNDQEWLRLVRSPTHKIDRVIMMLADAEATVMPVVEEEESIREEREALIYKLKQFALLADEIAASLGMPE